MSGDRLLHGWSSRADEWLDPVYARKSEKLTSKVRKYGIAVSSHPSHYADHSDDWYISTVSAQWILREQTASKLRREVRDEVRADYDEFRK